MATTLHLEGANALRRGSDQNIDLTVTDDGTASGTPIDITGWEFELTIRAQRDEPDTTAVLLTVTGTIISAVAGTYRYVLTDTQTLALAATGNRLYWWDSRRVNEDFERVLTEGRLEVLNTAGGRAS